MNVFFCLFQIDVLSHVGGSDAADMVKRILRRTLSDNVACEFSWYGKKGKKAFKSLHLADVIFSKYNMM